MIARTAVSVLVTVLITLLTVIAWMMLRNHQAQQVARIAETESYAARSQLVRNVDMMLRALTEVRDYWQRYGHLPRDQWASDAAIEQSHFDGLDLILWDDEARGNRYVRDAKHPVFDYRPTDEEWLVYRDLLARAEQARGESIMGPYVDASGKVTVEIHAVSSVPGDDGKLVAVLDTHQTFAHLLKDESPGYAISVIWNGVEMYQYGQPATGIPADWIRDGMIRTSMGTLWRVVHTPTAALIASLGTPAVSGVLVSGLIIAVLMGLLTFESGRARSRAAAAEIAEHKLAELNRGLESQITERTSQLAARTTDLETITDSVAHDLRNPLNSISVNTQLLQQQYAEALEGDGMDALQRTSTGVRRMTEILNRLLGLTVVSHATFNPQQVDLRTVVEEVFEELSAAEPPPAVELVVEDLPKPDADLVLVRTLIMNLLSNALKYTRDRRERRIEVCSEKSDGIDVFSISDNGVGFDPQERLQVFRAFERLGKGGSDGLGLGLDIAARVVRRHGGRIWADGRAGDGATFFFTLEPGYDPERGATEDGSGTGFAGRGTGRPGAADGAGTDNGGRPARD